MKKKTVSFKKVRILAKSYGTPLLVLCRRKIIENFMQLQACLPNVVLYYAVKANPNINAIKILNEIGGKFEISSIGELKLIEKLGIDKNKVLYTNPVKKEEEIRHFKKHGINLFIFDNKYELEKIARIAPNSEVLLRVAVPNQDCIVDLSYKFGIVHQGAEQAISKAISIGLRPRGLCFHVGSQNINSFRYVETLLIIKKIYDLMALRGIKLDIMDIGGGFPISYLEPVIPIEELCKPISTAINEHFSNVKVIAEPGRFIVGNTVTLIVKVIGADERNNVQWYYIDDGLYSSFSGKLFDHANYNIISERNNEKKPCIIAGRSCDSFDVVSSDKVLPKLEIGDLLIITNMGAYTSCSASEFCGFKKTRMIVVDDW